MNTLERRSVQRKGWFGLAVFAAIPLVGVALLTASFDLFMVVLLATLLLGTFALGGALLWRQLQAGKHGRAGETVSPLHGTIQPR